MPTSLARPTIAAGDAPPPRRITSNHVNPGTLSHAATRPTDSAIVGRQPMKYIFGPVNSRRLGASLGIDLLPRKICSFDCIYCEIGTTTELTAQRREYVPTSDICREIEQFLATPGADDQVDIFTVTASGEPTLHSGLGEIIGHLKRQSPKPVAVLTNGSLVHLPEVRRELALADLLVPSLDAALETSFRKVNRPAKEIALDQMIEGLAALRREAKGRFHLEILLVRGINHSPADIAALNRAIGLIKPDLVQLNTVARPPAEPFAKALSRVELEEIARCLPGPVEIIAAPPHGRATPDRPAMAEEILAMLMRRPCTTADICLALNIEPAPAAALLRNLETAGRVRRTNHNNEEYYKVINE